MTVFRERVINGAQVLLLAWQFNHCLIKHARKPSSAPRAVLTWLDPCRVWCHGTACMTKTCLNSPASFRADLRTPSIPDQFLNLSPEQNSI